jgi:L-ascorbate metabolism protein UlaG (beta-lactamase superfamily)
LAPFRVTYIGGPTAILEYAGLRFLTDPTFDPANTEYTTPGYTLHKTSPPALPVSGLGRIDAVLLSHDHHFDNLDAAGRAYVLNTGRTFTTQVGAERLKAGTVGLAPWETVDLPSPGGSGVRLTATPARHGPRGGDRGPVVGFVLEASGANAPVVYVSGDTVWYEGVTEVFKRFPIGVALLNLGAAKVAVAGPDPLTFTAADAVALTRAWPETIVVPLHFEGWAHFTEGAAEISAAFEGAGLSHRLRWLPRGLSYDITRHARGEA